MPSLDLTADEIVATINRSNFINIVIEGRDDVVAYRALERVINRECGNSVSLIPTGGRSKVLEVLSKVSGTSTLSRCIFICDKDMWVFSGVPTNIAAAGVVTTDGYSIENDILRDYPPGNLMDDSEIVGFNNDLEYFSKWFAVQVHNIISGGASELSRFPGTILDQPNRPDLSGFVGLGGSAYEVFSQIERDVGKYLRGKSLMQIVLRQLARKGRDSRHNHLAYIEHGAAVCGPFFARIIEEVRSRVGEIVSNGVQI